MLQGHQALICPRCFFAPFALSLSKRSQAEPFDALRPNGEEHQFGRRRPGFRCEKFPGNLRKPVCAASLF
jgi:hypothetical protein